MLARVGSEARLRVRDRRRSRIISPSDEEMVVAKAVSSFAEAMSSCSEEDARGDAEARRARAVAKATSVMFCVVEQHLKTFSPKPRRHRSSGSAGSGMLSRYEEERQRKIAANHAFLRQIGLA